MSAPAEMDELEPALLEFQRRDFEYGIGFTGHGPMAAEALLRLGHASLIPALVDLLAPRMPPMPEGQPLAASEWSSALGDYERRGDWLATFAAETGGDSDWRGALRDWLPRLLPGAFASAAHGLLRTAHATRALAERETPARRAELAHGLALWAASFQTLPGEPGRAPSQGLGPREALSEVPIVPLDRRPPGLFTDAVSALDEDPAFVRAIERVDLAAAPPGEWLSELCAASAALYLEHPGSRIAYVHCVTAPSALRLLGEFLTPNDERTALGVAFQCVAALHAVSAGVPEEPDPRRALELEDRDRLAENPAELRYRAACSLEEHAIKFAEACLREDAIAPDPSLRRAAADGALALGVGSWG